MSSNNGVIRIGRKGKKKFAFGEEGTPGSEPFEIDVVDTFHQWLSIDDSLRPVADESGNRNIPQGEMSNYHQAAVEYVESLRAKGIISHGAIREGYVPVNTAEALDFLARLRESYDELVVFFRPKSQEKQDSQDTSEVQSEMRFSVEEEKS